MSKPRKSKSRGGNPTHSLSRKPKITESQELVDLFQQGRYAELATLSARLAERCPSDAFVWKALGMALYFCGRIEEAVAPMRNAVALDPRDAQLHNNLGCALRDLGLVREAEACCRKALAVQPDYPQAHNTLGRALQDQGRFDEAIACYRMSLRLNPNSAETYNNLGTVAGRFSQFDDAISYYQKALAIKGDFAQAHYNLGNALRHSRRLTEAVSSYQRALAIRPNFADVYANLGIAWADLARWDEARTAFEQALKLRPSPYNYSTYLFFSSYRTDLPVTTAVAEARRYRATIPEEELRPYSEWLCVQAPSRLKLGLVSGDFRDHPVGYFLESVLQSLHQERVEIVAYTTDPRSDLITDRIRALCSEWKTLVGLSEGEAAQLVHADGIHILVDLAGHTSHNRLPVFAWKPAPVQVTWLGYFATTGLSEIDYILVDPYSSLLDEEAHFVESRWFLPETRLCFSPPGVNVPIGDSPVLSNQFLTFGCFNHLAKLNDQVLACWSQILLAIPNSRLLLKAPQLADAAVMASIIDRFAGCGIASDRLILEGPSPRAEYLAAYNRVDVVLDPFPYPGGTTTAEALWMGVPALTLKGDRLLSRQGESMLINVGLAEWIAEDPEDYVAKAMQYGADSERLCTLRQGLRERLLSSPLCDAERFAGHLALAFWDMWSRWESSQPTAPDESSDGN